MSKRARVAIPWPSQLAPRETLLALLAGDLRQGPLDVVLVAPADAHPRLPTHSAGSAPGIGPALETAREAGQGACLLVADADPETIARQLLGQGRVDALVLATPPDGPGPCLWVRDGVRVVEACPELGLGQLPGALDAASLADSLRRAGVLLQQLGCRRPRVALCDLAEAPQLREAARAAQGQDLEISGPSPAELAVRERADAIAGVIRAHVFLPLELLGSGPPTVFPLEETQPLAWPGEPSATALFLAVSRAAGLAQRPYAAEREQAKRKVSVTARSDGTPTAAGDRCPYCHRGLHEGELPGAPARCVTCGTGHHRECVAEHGHCTLLGCPGTEVERLGVRFAVARLGPDEPQLHPFESLQGDTGSGPRTLRIERPIDDPDTRTAGRPRLSLRLSRSELRRGERVEGYVVVASPRPFAVRGGVLRLRTTLTTQQVASDGTRRIPRPQPILAREALWVGQTPAGALGRLQDGVVALFGNSKRVEIPAGVRRWPFAFLLADDHPPTVTNRFKDTEEAVSTVLEVELDTETASISLVVR